MPTQQNRVVLSREALLSSMGNFSSNSDWNVEADITSSLFSGNIEFRDFLSNNYQSYLLTDSGLYRNSSTGWTLKRSFSNGQLLRHPAGLGQSLAVRNEGTEDPIEIMGQATGKPVPPVELLYSPFEVRFNNPQGTNDGVWVYTVNAGVDDNGNTHYQASVIVDLGIKTPIDIFEVYWKITNNSASKSGETTAFQIWDEERNEWRFTGSGGHTGQRTWNGDMPLESSYTFPWDTASSASSYEYTNRSYRYIHFSFGIWVKDGGDPGLKWKPIIDGKELGEYYTTDQVSFSTDGGQNFSTTLGAASVGDQGYDADDFGLGIHVFASSGSIFFTTDYQQEIATEVRDQNILQGTGKEHTLTCVRVPYLQVNTTQENNDPSALQFLYANQEGYLGLVTLDTSNPSTNLELDISPSINNVDHYVIGPHAFETFGGDTSIMMAFVKPVGGGSTKLIRSTNGGMLWTIQSSSFNGDWIRFVEPLAGGNGSKIWVAGTDGIAYSTDGGATFSTHDPADGLPGLPDDVGKYLSSHAWQDVAFAAEPPSGQPISSIVASGISNASTNLFVSQLGKGGVYSPTSRGGDLFGGGCATPDPLTGNPVQLRNGNKQLAETDLSLVTPAGSLQFSRLYDQTKLEDPRFQALGLGWTHNQAFELTVSGTAPQREMRIYMGNGYLNLAEDADLYQAGVGAHFMALAGSSSTVEYDAGTDRYILIAQDYTRYLFDGTTKKLVQREYISGEVWTYTYDGSNRLIKVEDNYGRELQFSYISNTGQFDDGQLWRVGDQTASGLSTGSPSGRYIELGYSKEQNNGVDVTNPRALLASVQDVRGEIWSYTYYGQASGETDTAQLNFLTQRSSPSVDTDGDEVVDSSFVLEALAYTVTNGDITEIFQQRGDNLVQSEFDFLVANATEGTIDTTHTTAGKTTTHHFADDNGSAGVYLGTSNPLGEGNRQGLSTNYRPFSQIDANGNETNLEWSEDGERLERVYDAHGNQTSFTYNVDSTLSASLDTDNRKTVYSYADSNNPRLPTSVKVYEDWEETTLLQQQNFTYDSQGRTLTERQIDPSDGTTVLRETTRSYYSSGDGAGLLEKITRKDLENAANNQETTYFYDSAGRTVQVNQSSTFGNCTKSRTVYDAAGNVLASICNYDHTGSHPTTVAEAIALFDPQNPDVNRVTTHAYDALGRRVQTTVDAGAAHAQTNLVFYDALGRVTRTITRYIDQSYAAPGQWVWEAGAWKDAPSGTTIDHGSDNHQNLITDTAYNARNQVRMTRDVLGQVTLYGYDDADRLVKTVQNAATANYNNDYLGTNPDPDLSAYPVDNQLLDGDLVTEQAYDANGNLIWSKDVLGQVTLTGYDALNRVVKTVRNASQPTYNVTADPTLSAYEASNVTDQDLITETEYDAMGRVRRNLDVSGNVTLLGYDTLDRQVRTIRNASAPDYNLAADPDLSAYPISTAADEDIVSDIRYDAEGKTAYTEDLDGNRTLMGYDGLGRQVKTVQQAVTPAYDFSADPDLSGYVEDTTVADGDLITETVYDSDGRVHYTTDSLGRHTAYGYDSRGRRVLTLRNATTPSYNFSSDLALTGYTLSSAADEDLITRTVFDTQGRVEQTIDHLGRVSHMVYDTLGRRVMSIQNYVVQGTSNPANWVWDAVDQRWEDGAGNPIDHGVDEDQNIISHTTYDLAGRVSRSRNVAGQETRFTYDALGRRVKTIQNYVDGSFDPQFPDEDLISETTYNKAGQVLTTTNARGTITRFGYDAAGRRISTTYADGTPLATTDQVRYDKAGRVTERTDALNHAITYTHDQLGRVVSMTDKEGNTTTTTYAKDGGVIEKTDAENTVTRYVYDKLRRTIRTIRGYVPTTEAPELWDWDGVDERWELSTGDPIAHGTNYDQNVGVEVEFDKAGRRTSQRDPRGYETSYQYDKLNRRLSMTNPLSHSWSTDYTDLPSGGTTVTLTDPMGYETERVFDRLGRLGEINYLPHATATDLEPLPDVRFGYDRQGNRISMQESLNSNLVRGTAYGYDAARRLTQVAFDTDGDTLAEDVVDYSYDAGGLRTSMTVGSEMTITYSYNERGQLIGMTSDIDAQQSSVSYQYDLLGRRLQENYDTGFSTRYRYDNNGRLRNLHHKKGAQTLARYQYAVDGRGNRIQAIEQRGGNGSSETILPTDSRVRYPKGSWVDNNGVQESTDFNAAFEIDFVGQTLTLTLANSPNGGIVDIYADGIFWGSRDTYHATASQESLTIVFYENRPHVLRVSNRGEHHLASSGYRLGLVEAVVDGSHLQTLTYAYDQLGRLLSAETFDASDTSLHRYDYQFDLAGNRIQEDVTASGMTTTTHYTYNEINQLTSDGASSYTYDANGNLIHNGADSYVWNRANKLHSVGNHTYTYNGLGQRVMQTVNSLATQYLLDVQPGLEKVIRATNGTNNDRYVHDPLHGIQQHVNGNTHWLLKDGLGSVREVVDNTLSATYSVDRDPYGNVIASVGSNATPFGYTGEMLDRNGLAYHRARYYDAGLGVWLSQDPLEVGNRYGYVDGNPANFIDLIGLYGETPPTCQTGSISQNCCGLDVTDWFLEEIRNHSQWADTINNEANSIGYIPATITAILPQFSLLSPVVQWGSKDVIGLAALISYARAIPHKWMNFAADTSRGCPSSSCQNTITLCGSCMDKSEMGNIIFGMAAKRVLSFGQLEDDIVWWAGRWVYGLGGKVEEAATGIGLHLGANFDFQNSNTQDLCHMMKSASGTWSLASPFHELNIGDRNLGVPHSYTWNWSNLASNLEGRGCTPCYYKLPSWYGHTVPSMDRGLLEFWSISGGAAGTSPLANREDFEDPFFVYQLPPPYGWQYLDPRLCDPDFQLNNLGNTYYIEPPTWCGTLRHP